MSNFQDTAARIVNQEVMCCMSGVVARLGELMDEQAYELSAPTLDYEEAAIQEGWRYDATNEEFRLTGPDNPEEEDLSDAKDWQALCEEQNIEPYEREVYEFWAVSTWLAEALQARGERVDTDFCGLNVWARTTTGQAISMDSVIENIVREMGVAE